MILSLLMRLRWPGPRRSGRCWHTSSRTDSPGTDDAGVLLAMLTMHAPSWCSFVLTTGRSPASATISCRSRWARATWRSRHEHDVVLGDLRRLLCHVNGAVRDRRRAHLGLDRVHALSAVGLIGGPGLGRARPLIISIAIFSRGRY